MNKHLFFAIACALFAVVHSAAQGKSLSELIDPNKAGWKTINEWKSTAKNNIEFLPKQSKKADSALLMAQVTTRSTMGAIIYETGGILIDSGWIRILGSGSPKLSRSLMEWNKGKTFTKLGQQPKYLLIADDVIGGFFAINGGALDTANIGKVFYFAPESLEWECLDMTYSDFIDFCFTGNLKEFYADVRWTNWQKDIASLSGDAAISIYPFLWSTDRAGKKIDDLTRTVVTIQDIWDLYANSQIDYGD